MRLAVATLIAALVVGCGGSDGPSSSSTPTAPASGSVSITVSSLSGTTERTATGVTYHVTFTLRATGSIGAMVTAFRVNLTNGQRSGAAIFDNISERLTPGGTLNERLSITSPNDTDPFNLISGVAVSYRDDQGVTSSVTSGSGAISGAPNTPPPTPSPTCSFSATPSGLALGATGSSAKGTIQVTTTSTCSWAVTIADGWLTASRISGSGSGSIAVEAAGNVTAGGNGRSTRMSVGTATVVVTQAGETARAPTPTPSPIPSSCNVGPYEWDANPNVMRCRNRLGQFAPSVCCGR
jgi:hypothetical protein